MQSNWLCMDLMMNTRQIKTLNINRQQLKKEAEYIVYEQACKELDVIRNSLDEILEFGIKLLNDNPWVYIKNLDVYYNYSVNAVFPNFKTYSFGHNPVSKGFNVSEFNNEFSCFIGELMTRDEFQKAFTDSADWFSKRFPHPTDEIFFSVDDFAYCYSLNGIDSKKWGGFSREETYHIPIYRLHRKINKGLSPIQVLYLWFRNNMIPESLPDRLLKGYTGIIELTISNKDYFIYDHNLIELNYNKILEDIMEKELTDKENMLKDMQQSMGEISISKKGYDNMIRRLLDCDLIRCDIESYDEKILSDPNRGHWELWEESKETDKYTIKLEEGLIARNPIADIKYDGVIGIDFGTKSTVVVYQDNTEHTLPMRIGTGQISKKVEVKHYENPTVMELINLDNFLECYYKSAGRPDTHWEDLIISHAASSSMINSSSTDYYSYFYEFKQWAGDKRRQIRLKDKQNKDILLPPFLEIGENEFNPIEIYAYYIGLYINNMNNGIYLDYIMSFPVTYESAIRKKITESFEKGIRRSLPVTILKDEEAMKRFRVTSSISEPAAYAICALEEAYSDLEEDEYVYYGIFDFGGGTTDFDYGVWRESEKNERKYDYVLECFGAGGDQYLGGENLLELLAFEIFKDNQDILRTDRISFVLPNEVKKFPGSEILLSESQEAKLNMRQLMEALRPYWEQQEGYAKLYEDGKINVTLFTKEGEARVNYELSIHMGNLEIILKSRIRRGVYNFFEGLKAAFSMPDKAITKIDIFLAGNSSRSPIVTELFDEYIKQYADNITFIVHPPLGFNKRVQEKKNIQNEYLLEDINLEDSIQNEEDYTYITKPTGKTGVAFGLIEGRPGGRVKIVLPDMPKDQNGEQLEIRFKYFIGYKKKQCFNVISDRDIMYGEWIELYDASEEDFTIYYTSLPEALTNKMSILDVNKKNCRINKTYKDANIYYRAVSPTTIEYMVAKEGDIEKGEYLENTVEIELS